MTKFIPQYAFGRGEIAPQFYGRADLQQIGVALKNCENFQVLRSGGLVNRAGTKFVGEVKDSSKKPRLIRFSFNTEQSYALEFGDMCMRVVKDGGYVVLPSTPSSWVTATAYGVGDHVSQGGVNYYCRVAHTSGTFATDLAASKWYALSGLIVEIPTQYAVADLPKLKHMQSADTMTLTHPSYPQVELARYSHYKWVMSQVSFTTTLTAPSTVTVTAAQVGGGTLASPDAYSASYYYVVTTVDADGNESIPSTGVGCLSKIFGYATNSAYPYTYPKNTITWAAVTGAYQYNIYRKYQGLYSLIGTVDAADTRELVDNNITPDPTQGPPVAVDPFTGSNYPQCACYYEQRMIYAGLANAVQDVVLSQTGNYHSFYKSEPIKGSDGFKRTLAARKVCEIRHLVPIRELVALTSGSIWKLGAGSQSDTIEPSSLNAKQQSEIGVSHVPPIVIGDRILFVQDMGSVVRDIGYDFAKDNYSGEDLSIFSSHMFQGYEITEWAHASVPNSWVYAVRSDGSMLCLTYLKEQEMAAWSRIVTDGEFESVVSVPEGSEDAVYCVVKRTINGATKRYVERFASRQVLSSTDAWFVDCALQYSGTPISTVTGLDHLEGKTVAILADGAVMPQQAVTGGAITLSVSASVITIGLPFVSTLETLPIGDNQGAIGRIKKVVKLRARVTSSRGMWAGPDLNNMTELKRRSWDASLITDEVQIGVIPAYSEQATIIVQQRDPLPMSMLCLIPEIEA